MMRGFNKLINERLSEQKPLISKSKMKEVLYAQYVISEFENMTLSELRVFSNENGTDLPETLAQINEICTQAQAFIDETLSTHAISLYSRYFLGEK